MGIKKQVKTYGPKRYSLAGTKYKITAEVRHDGSCGNGHNSFAITGEIRRLNGKRWVEDSFGALHDDIVKHFPELKPFIKWHLSTNDGPLHYIANTTFHAGNLDCFGKEGKERDFDAARKCAVWPEATDKQLSLPREELTKLLEERRAKLLEEFKKDVLSLGMLF